MQTQNKLDELAEEIAEAEQYLEDKMEQLAAGVIGEADWVEIAEVVEDELRYLREMYREYSEVPERVRASEERADWDLRQHKENSNG